ncbi:MAG: undecaprenyldiphospho-muramoylpentapeptide beta-N-acetylglucosaminyltransferase [Cyanobacteria bacterium P01_E01_bin.34]
MPVESQLESSASTQPTTNRLLIAASGTGGHLFPALAVAEHLSDVDIHWLGVPDRLETQLITDYPLTTVAMSGLQGPPGLSYLRAFWQLGMSFLKVRGLLKKQDCQGVFTTGGYISAPAILAARSLGLPVILHESNALPGKVTRWLAPRCSIVVLGVSEAATKLTAPKIQVVGNPVRQVFNQPQSLDLPIPVEAPTIVVSGGSQGARGLNRLVTEAAPAWIERGAWIIHLAGELDADEVAQRAPDSPQYLHFPFRQDMAAIYQRADFAICRSGAMTLAELAVTRTPAILIPYPYAAEDHQYENAIAVVNSGAAIVHREGELTAETLAALGCEWLDNRDRLQQMVSILDAQSQQDASQITAQLIRDTLEQEK